jgi:hypothetical protein
MKHEYEITMRIRVEGDNMESATECAEAIVADLLKDGGKFIDRPINMAEWDSICPIHRCVPKKEMI